MRSLGVVFLFACGSGGGFVDAPPPPDASLPGMFSLAWTIQDNTGAATTCDAAQATTVRVKITNTQDMSFDSQSFNCGLGSAASGGLFAGTYDLDFDLLGASGTIASGTSQMGVALMSGKTTQLTPVTFMTP